MKRRLKRALAFAALAVLSAAAWIYLVPFPEELLDRGRATPVRFFDREGRLLRQGLSAEGTRGTWVPLPDISPRLAAATIAAEDRRFRDHPGVDVLAVLRAAKDNVAAGRRVSGASTITMQLVRLLRPRPRTWRVKLEEAVLALRLERRLSKDQILEEYLNRAPYGGNWIGAEAGARRTFGKPARDLSPAEAALLAGLPQSPVRLDPLRRPERARRRQRWILDEMLRSGDLDEAAWRRAIEEGDAIASRPPPCEARSFVDWVLRPGDAEVRTTLDLGLQREVEGIVRGAGPHLADCGAGECAVVVVDNASGEVRAFAGPAARRRSPGSTLKPFVFALALEAGGTPASVYEDAPVQFETPTGVYAPRNYDGEFRGPVTMRAALANSLNIPAVLALREAGLPRLVRLLREAGLEGIDPDPRRHGLGLAIGNAAVSPVELAGAYAMLARGGEFLPVRARPGSAERRRLLSPETAFLIADILADDGARAAAFGTGTDLAFDFPVAAKTGTSPDHRDNWAAGFTRTFTAVVWAGNGDGRPLRGTSGLEGAGPVFREVMLRVGGGWVDRPGGIVESEVCAETGLRPGAGCGRTVVELFPAGRVPRGACAPRPAPFRLESPRPGDRFVLDPSAPAATRFLRFRARGPEGASLEWYLNGERLAVTAGEHEVAWSASAGAFELRVLCGPAQCVRRFQVR